MGQKSSVDRRFCTMPSMRKRSLLPTVCLNGSEHGPGKGKEEYSPSRPRIERKLAPTLERSHDRLVIFNESLQRRLEMARIVMAAWPYYCRHLLLLLKWVLVCITIGNGKSKNHG